MKDILMEPIEHNEQFIVSIEAQENSEENLNWQYYTQMIQSV